MFRREFLHMLLATPLGTFFLGKNTNKKQQPKDTTEFKIRDIVMTYQNIKGKGKVLSIGTIVAIAKFETIWENDKPKDLYYVKTNNVKDPTCKWNKQLMKSQLTHLKDIKYPFSVMLQRKS